MKKLSSLVSLCVALFLVYGAYLHRDSGGDSSYVTSEACAECHQANYVSWKENTLHPRMFRPVESPGDVLGDFSSDDPALTFTLDDVEFVVGNKWEQVYARRIDGEYYPLPAKWHVMQQRWEPYKVDDWRQTSMSRQCNGCHTTGFDPVTMAFNEYGIGCEACHGPGGRHVQNRNKQLTEPCSWCHGDDAGQQVASTDIIRSVSPTVCGQCHNRGQNAPKDDIHGAEFDFPVRFLPNEELLPAFVPLTREQDKKGKYWWGNGIAKNRHQEFGEWSESKHANGVKKLRENYQPGGDRGVLGDQCLHCHSTDYRHAEADSKPTLDTAQFGITCVACHEPHGRDRHRAETMDGVTRCGGCHVDSMSRSVARQGRAHYPCPTATVTCADCHMPRIVKTGGFFSIRSHAFRIVAPEDARKLDMPSSCQNGGCHEDRSTEWAVEEFKRHYPAFKTAL